ncbi:MAG: hypothetical protein HFJ50_10420 [Clostridia bacterium]|jgi:hypothetical protein|nr:hypothetical protein [Clostridia bacterium]
MMGVFYSHEETYEEYLQKKFKEFVEKDLDISKLKGRELSEAELIAKRIPPFKGWDTDS